MKFNYLIKASPFLSTLLLIIFLVTINQKENTKLRILIWNTPTLSLGTYLAISTGTGFILSYCLTTSLAKLAKKTPKETLKYDDNNKYDESSVDSYINSYQSYDNTLIERDIKDPSPTINANFRVIGKTERSNKNYIDNDNFKYDDSNNFGEKFDFQADKNETINKVKLNYTDWDDESYSRW